MLMQKSIHRNGKQWKQIGAQNHLNILSLIDEFIKRDEEIERSNRRTNENNRRLRMDEEVIKQHMKRIGREKQNTAMTYSNRFMESEKRKKDGIESANRRWKQMEKEEKERKHLLAMRVENAKRQRERAFEKERGDNYNKQKQHLDYSIAKSFSIKRHLQQKDEKYQSEIDAMRARAYHFERLRHKARLGAEQTVHTIEKRRQQKLQQSLRHFREQERKYEQETMALVARIDELEKMKERQRELLKQRNEKFRVDLERRKQMTMSKVKSDLKWKQEYVAKLKLSMSEVAKRKDTELSECMDNLALVQLGTQNKERQLFFRKRHALDRHRKEMQEMMQYRTGEMNERNEHVSDNVIDATQKLEIKKNGQKRMTECIHDIEVAKPELRNEVDFVQTERAKTMLRFEEEADEREKSKIRNEFKKLMGSFRTKSVTFAQ